LNKLGIQLAHENSESSDILQPAASATKRSPSWISISSFFT
jgi:hypothetical protein